MLGVVYESLDVGDVVFASDDQGGAGVQAVGFDIEDAAVAGGGGAACLFGDEGQWIGFVHQAELALGFVLGGRVKEDAAFEEDAMKVSDQ